MVGDKPRIPWWVYYISGYLFVHGKKANDWSPVEVAPVEVVPVEVAQAQ